MAAIQLAASYGELYFSRCCALKRTGTFASESKVTCSLRVAVPTPPRKNGREGTSTKTWRKSCSVTSRFCMKICNGSLLDKGSEQYFREY